MFKQIAKSGIAVMLSAGMFLAGCSGNSGLDDTEDPIPTSSIIEDPSTALTTIDDTSSDTETTNYWCDGVQVYSDEEDACVDNPCVVSNPCTAAHTACVFDDYKPGNYDCPCEVGARADEQGECQPIPGATCDHAIALPGTEGNVEIPRGNYPNTIEGNCSAYNLPEVVYTLVASSRSLLVASAAFNEPCYSLGALYVQAECGGEGSLACGEYLEGEGGQQPAPLPREAGEPDTTSASDESPNSTDPEVESDTWPQDTEACERLDLRVQAVVEPGQYSLIVESGDLAALGARLSYALVADPCAGVACDGGKSCVPNEDWLAYECHCAQGSVEIDGLCIDDPCVPNPCGDAAGSLCTMVTAGDHQCSCLPGFENGEEGCRVDPNARGEGCGDLLPALDETNFEQQFDEDIFYAENYADDAQGSCGGAGPDLVLTLHVRVPSYFYAGLNGGNPIVYVRNQCGNPASELVCATVDPRCEEWDASDTESQTDSLGCELASIDIELDPGDYSVFFDNDSSSGPLNYYWGLSPL
ncbi:MAG: hypothetical protein MUC50_12940 [Myxococcota bacterium]|jgi:hypothetical protein|nr:hypothetical protein [Myxococcota bacterium]